MCGSCIGRKLSFLLVLTVLIAVDGLIGSAQAQQSTLPGNWQQLSPPDFATLIRNNYFDGDAFKALSNSDQESLKSQGEKLFTQIDLSNTSLSYQTLEMLHWVARNEIDQSEIDAARNALIARQDDWTNKPYSEIRAKVAMMLRLKAPYPILSNEVKRWIAGGGTIQQVPARDLAFAGVRQLFADNKLVARSFSVEWVGQINAPQSGDYTFLISPIDINAGYHETPFRFNITVMLSGQSIITAGPTSAPPQSISGYPAPQQSKWVSQANPVTLTAGTPVSLRVLANVDAPLGFPIGSLHALLLWQGPRIAKSLVPASAFSQSGTGNPGLTTTYAWTAGGSPQSMTRTDPMLDFAWTNSPIFLAADTTPASQSADTLWQNTTSADFLAWCTKSGPTVKLHPFLQVPDDVSSGLSTARRDAFLDLLLQNPAMLDAADAKQIVHFYESFRIGTPDKALNAFGAWATRNADLACEISADRVFEGDVRRATAWMAILTTQQLPDQSTRLQNEFLQLPDGRCSLPVAYTLAYSYVGRKKLADWIGVLDAKLADPALTGDVRVNWLLARAFAQELNRLPPRHYPFRYSVPSCWPLDSATFLNQAIQTAQSPATKMRVAREIVGRLAFARRFSAAKDMLQQLLSSLPDDQKTVVVAWQHKLDGFVADEAKTVQGRPAAANRAYVATLKVRRDAASKQGNTAAAERYDALINAANSAP
jgi:hypothetical protein